MYLSNGFFDWIINSRMLKYGVRIAKKYFSTFDGTSSYAALTDEIVLSGDFEIEVDFKKDSAGSMAICTGQNGFLRVDSNGSVIFRDENYNQFEGSNFPPDTERHKLIFKYNSTTGALESSVDGVALITRNAVTFPFSIVKVGVRGGSNADPFNGQLSDLKIWSGGDRSTGNLILDLPMSEGLKDVYDEVFYRNRVQAQAEWLLTSNANSQIEFQDIALSGDFEIEVDYKSLSTGNTILGFSDDTALYYQNSSNVSFRVKDTSGTDVYGGSAPLSVGVAARVVFKLDNGVFRCSVNGVFGSSRDMSTTKKSTYYFNSLAGGNPFNDSNNISNLKIWQGGDRTTGTLIIDSALDDNSNIIANAASPVNANVWDDSSVSVVGDSEILGGGSYRVYSSDGSYSTVKIFGAVATNVDYLMELELVSGDVQKIIPQEITTNFSGWQNIRDPYGQPTNRYKTIVNSLYTYLQLKRLSGVTDVTVKSITVRKVEGYGVLQGARNTDYNWTNSTPHAIGYNVTTTANN